MSTSASTLQDVASVDELLNVAATETVPLFEYLEFDFLLEYDVFAPSTSSNEYTALAVDWSRLKFSACVTPDDDLTDCSGQRVIRSSLPASRRF